MVIDISRLHPIIFFMVEPGYVGDCHCVQHTIRPAHKWSSLVVGHQSDVRRFGAKAFVFQAIGLECIVELLALLQRVLRKGISLQPLQLMVEHFVDVVRLDVLVRIPLQLRCPKAKQVKELDLRVHYIALGRQCVGHRMRIKDHFPVQPNQTQLVKLPRGIANLHILIDVVQGRLLKGRNRADGDCCGSGGGKGTAIAIGQHETAADQGTGTIVLNSRIEITIVD